MRVLHENQAVLPQQSRDNLLALAHEIPDGPVRVPDRVLGQDGVTDGDIGHFNAEWAMWALQRSTGNWTTALPLINAEIYYYRRILDATKYFVRDSKWNLVDPFESQKQSSLSSALSSKIFQEAARKHLQAVNHKLSNDELALEKLFVDLVHSDLWSRDCTGCLRLPSP
jgi:hypothetical protein